MSTRSTFTSVEGTRYRLSGPWPRTILWGASFQVGDESRAVDPATNHFSSHAAGAGAVWVDVNIPNNRLIDEEFSAGGGTVRVVAGNLTTLAPDEVTFDEKGNKVAAEELFSYAYWSDGVFEIATAQLGRASAEELLNRFGEISITPTPTGPVVNMSQRRSGRSVHHVRASAHIPDHGSLQFDDRRSQDRLPVPKWAGHRTQVGELWSLSDAATSGESIGMDPAFQNTSALLVNRDVSAIVTPEKSTDVTSFVESIQELSASR